MSDVNKEPDEKKKAGRKPRAVSTGAAKATAKTSATAMAKAPAAKSLKKPVAEKKAAPKGAKAAVEKKAVQTPGADPAPQAVTQKPVAVETAPQQQSFGSNTAPKPNAAQEDLLAEGWKKFKNWDIGLSVKVILILVVIGVIASILKHF